MHHTARTHETPRGSIVLRPTRAEDAEAYRALRLDALQRHPLFFGGDYAGAAAQPMDYWREQMRVGAGHSSGITYVAEAANELVGMTRLQRDELPKFRHSANIYSVYVQAAWRGLRLADALLNTCCGWGAENGVRIVRLGVAATNASALRCYLRCGFSVYGVEQESLFHEGVYYDELLMHRRLVR